MGGMFSAPKIPPPTPVAPPPTPTTPVVQQQADALVRNQAQAGGAASTMLTGGQGTAAPTVLRKTLLGQ